MLDAEPGAAPEAEAVLGFKGGAALLLGLEDEAAACVGALCAYAAAGAALSGAGPDAPDDAAWLCTGPLELWPGPGAPPGVAGAGCWPLLTGVPTTLAGEAEWAAGEVEWGAGLPFEADGLTVTVEVVVVVDEVVMIVRVDVVLTCMTVRET